LQWHLCGERIGASTTGFSLSSFEFLGTLANVKRKQAEACST
jgi:hypothetical protein